jgi:hypothetical protein
LGVIFADIVFITIAFFSSYFWRISNVDLWYYFFYK